MLLKVRCPKWVLVGWHQDDCRATLLSGSSGVEAVSLLFLFLELTCFARLSILFFYLLNQQQVRYFSHCHFFFSLLLSLIYQDSWPTYIIQDNLCISRSFFYKIKMNNWFLFQFYQLLQRVSFSNLPRYNYYKFSMSFY